MRFLLLRAGNDYAIMALPGDRETINRKDRVKMTFRQTGICRLIVLVLALCMLAGAASVAAGEPEMTEEQVDEASKKAYDEAKLQGETEIAFTLVATIGQHLSDLMAYAYGGIPASETNSANAAVQLVDEVIRRADHCFRSEGAVIDAKKLAAFDRAKEAWKTASAQFGAEGETFEAGLPLTDQRVFDPAAGAFARIPAEAQADYLEKAENVFRTIWQALRPAVAAKVGEALGIPWISELAGSERLSKLEDAAVKTLADLKNVFSTLSDGFYGERSRIRERIEQAGSRLNTLESEVKLVTNALGHYPETLLQETEEK